MTRIVLFMGCQDVLSLQSLPRMGLTGQVFRVPHGPRSSFSSSFFLLFHFASSSVHLIYLLNISCSKYEVFSFPLLLRNLVIRRMIRERRAKRSVKRRIYKRMEGNISRCGNGRLFIGHRSVKETAWSRERRMRKSQDPIPRNLSLTG